MEKDRSFKVIAIVGLIVAVVALSVGFAAYSQNLTISSNATYSPESNVLDVYFTANESETGPTTVAGVATPSTDGPTASNAVLTASTGSTTISGLSANFTDKGQKVTYNFYVHNASEYIAYLKSVTFANAQGGTSNKLCTAGTGTTTSMVEAACGDVSITVNVHSTDYTSSVASITGKSIAVSAYTPISVTIAYDASKTSSNVVPDGDFSVAFGDITLGYSSAE